MSAALILDDLAARGISARAENGRIALSGAAGAITPELRRRVSGARDELLRALAGRDALAAPIPRLPRDGTRLPLSPAQRRMWLAQKVAGGAAYTVGLAYAIDGELDLAALRRALVTLVERHEVLRTRYVEDADGPAQAIDPPPAEWPLAAEEAGEDEARRIAAAESAHTFDLAREWPLRTRLLRAGRGRHLLLATMHHIASDGWSRQVLRRELASLYHAFRRGGSPALPPLPVQYADYAAWQDRLASGDALQAQRRYWRERLAGMEPLELPIDFPRPPAFTFRGRTRRFTVPREVHGRVTAFAREAGATPFMVYLAAFQLLLARHAGSDDVAVAVPVANRGRAEVEGLIGYFSNTVVMRGRAGADDTFAARVAAAREAAVDAYANQDLPFDEVVAELAPARDLSRNPLASVSFSYNRRDGSADVEGFAPVAVDDDETTRFDLGLRVLERADDLRAALTWCTDLFTDAAAERIAARFLRLLDAAVAAPHAPARTLPMLAAGEAERVMEMGTRPSSAPLHLALAGLFAARAAGCPGTVAVEDDTGCLTYAELSRRSRRWAAALAAGGVRPGDRVAVRMERSMELVTAVLAVVHAGGSYVPLDATVPVPAAAGEAGVRRWIAAEDVASLDAFPGEAGGAPEVDPGAEACLQFTSGTTGDPLAVSVAHRGVVRLVVGSDLSELAPGMRVSFAANPAFDASLLEIWGALLNGATLVVLSRETVLDPGRLRERMRRDPLDLLHITASIFHMVAAERPDAFRGVGALVMGGEVLDPAAVRRVLAAGPPRSVVNVYGPTENTGLSTCYLLPGEPGPGPIPIGRPIPGASCYALDPAGALSPIGVAGELYVGGPGLALGYAGNPARTAERFVHHPALGRLYRTGDRVRLRDDGVFEYLGRVDDEVKIAGRRVSADGLAAVIAEEAGAAQALVRMRDGRLVAWVLTGSEEPVDTPELRRRLRRRLPAAVIPAHVLAIPRLPLNANGKLDAHLLPSPGLAAAPPGPGEAGWETPLEETVAALWSEVLGRTVAGRDQEFFDVGGHSLAAGRVIARIEERCGLRLGFAEFFLNPTVAAQARLLEERAADAAAEPVGAAPVPLRAPGDAAPATPTQRRMWYLWQLAPEVAAYTLSHAWRLRGGVDRAALAGAVAELAARHPALRTVFELRGAELFQRVGERAPELEVRPVAPGEWAAEARRVRHAPFDLGAEPPARFVLFEAGGDAPVLLISLHHVACDGWSTRIVLRELAALYAARRRGAGAAFPVLTEDLLSIGERLARESPERGEAVRAAAVRLRGVPPLVLPHARPRPAVQAHRGARVGRRVEAAAADLVRAFARDRRTTPFNVLLAAYQVLLARLSGECDVAVGTPVFGRGSGAEEGVVGAFINTVVVRARLEGCPSLDEALERVRRASDEAFDAARLPFEELVEAAAAERETGRTPLFQVIFSYLAEVGEARFALDGCAAERLPVAGETARCDLSLYVEDGGVELRLGAVYDTALFDRDQVEDWLDRYTSLLETLVSDPAAPFQQPAVVRAPEPGDARSLADAFRDAAARWSGSVAVEADDGTWSYAELEARAAAVARWAASRGAERVGIRAGSGAAGVAAFLGIAGAGAIAVPLNPRHPEARLREIAGHAGVDAVLDEEAIAAAMEAPGSGWPAPPSGDHDAYILYTSGSSGTPKGIVQSHRNARWHGETYAAISGIGPGDRVSMVAPLSFDAALMDLFGALLGGATLLPCDAPAVLESRGLGRWLAEKRVTLFHATPTVARAAAADGVALPSLRLVVLGGEAAHAADLALLAPLVPPGCRWANGLGPTECTLALRHEGRFAALPEVDALPLGGPVPGLDVRLHTAAGEQTAVHGLGEVVIHGPQVARGYWRDPGATAAVFGPARYRTGDRARLLPDGTLACAGRIDAQLQVRGVRVEPREVEIALLRERGVREAAVVLAGERLVAYVVAAPGAEPAEHALRAALRERLPSSHVPDRVLALPALPRNANGKTDRGALAARPLPAAAGSALAGPPSDRERIVATAFRELLGVPAVPLDSSFFALGGTSLSALILRRVLAERLSDPPSLAAVFRDGTVRGLAAPARTHPVSHPSQDHSMTPSSTGGEAFPVAVIGLSVRLPGAPSPERLWSRLCRGDVVSTTRTLDEVVASGIPREHARSPLWVKAEARIEGSDLFDAGFFGMTPRQAAITSPDQRLYLEVLWETMENAGQDPSAARIGLFSGTGATSYVEHTTADRATVDDFGYPLLRYAAEPEHAATRMAFLLNLRGPVMGLSTACSTSLVAVHLAVEALRGGACDMALAGGAFVPSTKKIGYWYIQDGIRSPDGSCRVFDAEARGTLFGDGVGAVLLKPLDAALRDGDPIRAVILGSALNNDGARKAAYSAPSPDGQAEVIRGAVRAAGVDPATVTYLEAHGTGTAVGDPIEMAALTEVYGAGDAPCHVGAVKANVGHSGVAAGVVGLIRAIQVLEGRAIPPQPSLERLNPAIGLEGTRLRIARELTPWTAPYPVRAAVNSFGVGGTNAHVVLEEAPPRTDARPVRPVQLLPVSAASDAALGRLCASLADAIEAHPGVSLADVAFTLQAGRRAHSRRRAVVATDAAEAVRALREPARAAVAEPGRAVAFLFPGQGAQYRGMGRALYDGEPTYRAVVDECAELLRPELGLDVREAIFADAGDLEATDLCQPALFVVEYALARLYVSWGIVPAALLGHSVGEYVAACVGGVMELPDALRLVARRGKLMAGMREGAMLAVLAPEAEVRALLPDDVELTAVNAPENCVVGGGAEAVDRFAALAAERGVETVRLRTSRAFHTAAVDPLLDAFAAEVAATPRRAPSIPIAACATGEWMTDEEAAGVDYWTRQLRQPVRFAAALETLSRRGAPLLLEVGPGSTLAGFARAARTRHEAVTSLSSSVDDGTGVAAAVGRVWAAGANVDWRAHADGWRQQRVALPTYPFERRRHWIDAPAETAKRDAAPAAGRLPLAQWFSVPGWRPEPVAASDAPARRRVVVHGGDEFGQAVAAGLSPADAFAEPADDAGWRRVVGSATGEPCDFVYLAPRPGGQSADDARDAFLRLLGLAKALDARAGVETGLLVVSDAVHDVNGEGGDNVAGSVAQGVLAVMPQELPDVRARLLDLVFAAERADTVAAAIAAELAAPGEATVVACRRGMRWVQRFEPVRLPAPAASEQGLRRGGTYVITGGLGKIGLAVARWLARNARARLVLTTRRPLPDGAAAEDWLDRHGEDDRTTRRILQVKALRGQGAEVVVVPADAADPGAMHRVVAVAEDGGRAIAGVFHCAGVLDGRSFGALSSLTEREIAAQFGPKVDGVLALDEALNGRAPDFCLLASSISAILGGVGYAAYAAANAFMDAFAAAHARRSAQPWMSVNWDLWRFGERRARGAGRELEANAIQSHEGCGALARLLPLARLPRVAVSTTDLSARLELWSRTAASAAEAQLPTVPPAVAADAAEPEAANDRPPHLRGEYVPPRDSLETELAGMWTAMFGFGRIGIRDNFFELGGDSLLAIRLHHRLRGRFKQNLQIRDFLAEPTIEQLGASVRRQKSDSAPGVADAAALLRQVQAMSDEQVTRMLAELEAGGAS